MIRLIAASGIVIVLISGCGSSTTPAEPPVSSSPTLDKSTVLADRAFGCYQFEKIWANNPDSWITFADELETVTWKRQRS